MLLRYGTHTDRSLINKIEMVQKRAARFVTSNYSREPETVTSILQNLGWPTLETHRQGARLILLYKIIHGEAAVNIPYYIMRPSVLTRQYHQDRFSRVSTSTDSYKYSFIPRTIVADGMYIKYKTVIINFLHG
jgi:hypothetical protein